MLSSACKNSFNDTIGGVGMLHSPRALTRKSVKKIHQRMMSATFNGNACTTILSQHLTNFCDETDVITFDNELSSLVA